MEYERGKNIEQAKRLYAIYLKFSNKFKSRICNNRVRQWKCLYMESRRTKDCKRIHI